MEITWTNPPPTPAAALTIPEVKLAVKLAAKALSSSAGSAKAFVGTTTQFSWKCIVFLKKYHKNNEAYVQ